MKEGKFAKEGWREEGSDGEKELAMKRSQKSIVDSLAQRLKFRFVVVKTVKTTWRTNPCKYPE